MILLVCLDNARAVMNNTKKVYAEQVFQEMLLVAQSSMGQAK